MELKAITKDIIDSSIQVHRDLGPGLLESVYETVLEAELRSRGHKVERQKGISFNYRGLLFNNAFRIDLLIDDSIVLELKSAEKMLPVFAKQLKTYLALSGKTVGLLLNFGMPTLVEGMVRVVNNYQES